MQRKPNKVVTMLVSNLHAEPVSKREVEETGRVELYGFQGRIFEQG